jgi:hypothetical protein
MNKLKKFIKAFLRYILYFVPVDLILNISLKLFMFIAKISYFKSWNLEANGRPQFFKHRINLALWINGYSSWSFASRGTYARQQISKGSVVLDLCSGDAFSNFISKYFNKINVIEVSNDGVIDFMFTASCPKH